MNEALLCPPPRRCSPNFRSNLAAGFLPSHWLTLPSARAGQRSARCLLDLPILALLEQQPTGELKDFLLFCKLP
jgi:hypothetical protein